MPYIPLITKIKKKGGASTAPQSGISRIYAGLQRKAKQFAESYTVPEYSSYLAHYRYTEIPEVHRLRDVHKTHVVCHEKGQYVNYALRFCLAKLGSKAQGLSSERVAMVTLQFAPAFIRKLSLKKNPVSYYGQLVRYRFKKLDISDYFIVFESTSSRIRTNKFAMHAHIVFSMKASIEDESIKAALKRPRELLRASDSGLARTAYHICKGYKRRIKIASEADMEIFAPLSEMGEAIPEFDCKVIEPNKRYIYESSDLLAIDIGLADYLAKGLTKKLFGSSRNYYISSTLLRELQREFQSPRRD